MSKRKLDEYGNWRSKAVTFKMSPEEDELFERMMSAVDEELLEEAQRPVKIQTKRPWITLAASAAACIAVLASTMLRAPAPPPDTTVVNPLQDPPPGGR